MRNKTYNVYLLIEDGKKYIIKKVYEEYDEKVWYDKYFAKTNLPVPPIVNEIVINNEKYITMEYIDGKDARFCSQQEVKQVAHSLALIQNQFLENVIFSEESTNDTKQYYDRKNTRFLAHWLIFSQS